MSQILIRHPVGMSFQNLVQLAHQKMGGKTLKMMRSYIKNFTSWARDVFVGCDQKFNFMSEF